MTVVGLGFRGPAAMYAIRPAFASALGLNGWQIEGVAKATTCTSKVAQPRVRSLAQRLGGRLVRVKLCPATFAAADCCSSGLPGTCTFAAQAGCATAMGERA